MSLERDHMAERLARIESLLKATKETVTTMAQSDRALARELTDQLDAMLRELIGTQPKPRR